ncbi:hypothetical protein K2O51_30850 (plasmid) [Cupriavidus pinatubonensis]|uniref:hypothetical protein n=1 Tax=Cupriavidus pinatubonensis TaxID=248026 RepID=UPI001C73296B|nr:hypothetical protein [Cupriavidus pinatubonensis]QYY33649.1 hypothetical protein K2O51_30850 [Cupriavidus pinatubonensis]
MTRQNHDLSLDMHVKDFELARAAAERLGMGFSDYIRLGTHLMTTAVLSGSPTVHVPLGSAASKWVEKGKACVQEIIERAAA